MTNFSPVYRIPNTNHLQGYIAASERSGSAMQTSRWAYYVLNAPREGVQVVLQGGSSSSWLHDATLPAPAELTRYWAIEDGLWAPVLGDMDNGLLVSSHLFGAVSRFDDSVSARNVLIENAAPRSVASADYSLLRVRRKVPLSAMGSDEDREAYVTAALVEFPSCIVVSAKLREALETCGIANVFSEPRFAACP